MHTDFPLAETLSLSHADSSKTNKYNSTRGSIPLHKLKSSKIPTLFSRAVINIGGQLRECATGVCVREMHIFLHTLYLREKSYSLVGYTRTCRISYRTWALSRTRREISRRDKIRKASAAVDDPVVHLTAFLHALVSYGHASIFRGPRASSSLRIRGPLRCCRCSYVSLFSLVKRHVWAPIISRL